MHLTSGSSVHTSLSNQSNEIPPQWLANVYKTWQMSPVKWTKWVQGKEKLIGVSALIKSHIYTTRKEEKADTTTYRAVSIWVIIRNIDSELKHTILVEPMSYEYYTKPHCKWENLLEWKNLKLYTYKSILKSYIQTYLKLIGRRAARRHLATSASPPRYCNQSQHSESSTTTLTQQTQHVPPTAQQGLLPQTHSQFPRLLTEGDKYSEITLLPPAFCTTPLRLTSREHCSSW